MDELVRKIKRRADQPKRRTSCSGFELERFKLDPRWRQTHPPVRPEQIEQAEATLGFRLPGLLTRLYLEVGNGGFGPGFGLFGLEGGFTDEDQRLTLVELYQALPAARWPRKLVPICDWGDCMMSCVDCKTGQAKMVLSLDPATNLREGIGFEQWMEDWVKGVNLVVRAMRKGQ